MEKKSEFEGAPAFYSKPAMGLGKRIFFGIMCSVISLAVLFGVCYSLENFKEVALKEQKLNYYKQPIKKKPVKKTAAKKKAPAKK